VSDQESLAPDVEVLQTLEQRVALQQSREVATEEDIRFAQQVFALASRLYLAVLAQREDERVVPPPFTQGAGFCATECLVLANELLKYADVDVFELGLFRQYGVY